MELNSIYGECEKKNQKKIKPRFVVLLQKYHEIFWGEDMDVQKSQIASIPS